MAWVMALLGAALAVGGGISLWNGSGYIRLDWGQAETVAGTVALSAGVVTLGIAAVLFTLRDLAHGPARGPARAATSGVGLEAVHLSDGATPADAADTPAAPARRSLAGRLATVGLPKAERTAPEPAVLAREPDDDPYGPRDPVPSTSDPAEPEPVLDPRPRPVPEAPLPLAPAVAQAPTVVGRYEANGASYVLFSDGTIEVETDTGTHRFASMAALKDHIERQEAG